MPLQRMHATWLFASPGAGDLEGRLAANLKGSAAVFVQESHGTGALAISEVDSAGSLGDAEGERRGGEFGLRTVYPPGSAASIEDTPHLLVVRIFVPEGDRDEVRRWLDEEHCAFQLRVPGANWYLGYEQVGTEHSFLNLWELDDPAVIDAPAWAEARDTPWRSRLLQSFERQDRAVYRPIRSRASATGDRS